MKILLVDDERHIVEILARKLIALGYDTTTACNGEDALGKLRAGKFTLVVTDLDMPKMNGIELVKSMSRDVTLAKVPVIILTARGFLASSMELRSVVATLAKPFSARKVIDLVCSHLASASGAGRDEAGGAAEVPA